MPKEIIIRDEDGFIRSTVAGPYNVGDFVILKCEAIGGKFIVTVVYFFFHLLLIFTHIFYVFLHPITLTSDEYDFIDISESISVT